MGERKGQNHYYPADFNYKTHKTLNRYHGVHALRERGAKAHLGIITIRFEMPFNVWCLGCKNHIGMSVRYNAEKKKIGMYYTTPIYEFRMKCHLCDNYFTIRTDPKNFDYELVEGVRRQEIRFDPSTIDNLAPVDRTLSLKLSSDAMYKAEHVVEDKQKAGDDQQIQKLEWIQSRLHDDYNSNSILRKSFRMEKKMLNEVRAKDQEIKERLSTEITLLPEKEEDRLAAKRLAFGKYLNANNDQMESLTKEKVLNAPIQFGTEPSCSSSSSIPDDKQDSRKILIQKLQEKSVGKALSSSEIDSFENKILVKRNTLGVKIGAKSNMGGMTSPMSERVNHAGRQKNAKLNFQTVQNKINDKNMHSGGKGSSLLALSTLYDDEDEIVINE